MNYVYLIALPDRVREAVTPSGPDEYTIYIDKDLTREAQQAAYDHAVRHIMQNDFDTGSVQQIEAAAHGI